MNSTAPALIFRVVVVALLAAITFELHAIVKRLPPTLGDLRAAETTEERTKLMQNQPYTLVNGNVTVDGSVSIDGTVHLHEPVTVTIER